MEAVNKVSAITEVVKDFLSDTCHNVHVENNVDRVSNLNTCFCKRRTDNTHRERKNVHGSALHAAIIKLCKLSIHFLRVHPVVCCTCFFLCRSTDECAVFNTSNVINSCSVEIASRKLLFVELNKLAC